MTDSEFTFALLKLLAVLVLVLANGFFVAAEFSLVAIRRSRVQELVAEGNMRAIVLKRAVDSLDAYLAATQLGITMSSLALGWLGEPAIAQLVLPLLAKLPFTIATAAAHAIAIAFAFTLITAFHIVLGELAPKSLALQATEVTALKTVRLLEIFLKIFRPAIYFLNSLGNLVLKIFGLQPGSGEEHMHSTEELKLLVAASQEAGLLQPEQQVVMDRVLSIGDRRLRDIMTHLPDLIWVNSEAPLEEIKQTIRSCPYDQMIVSKGSLNEVQGILRKQDLYDQCADDKAFSIDELLCQPLIVHETMSIMKTLENFKKQPVHMAIVLDEYGEVQGLVTQTDLLSAIAGEMSSHHEEEEEIVDREDGSFMIDGMTKSYEAFEHMNLKQEDGDFHTLAGFVLSHLGYLPKAGEVFIWKNWKFEIIDVDERRIDKILVTPLDSKDPL